MQEARYIVCCVVPWFLFTAHWLHTIKIFSILLSVRMVLIFWWYLLHAWLLFFFFLRYTFCICWIFFRNTHLFHTCEFTFFKFCILTWLHSNISHTFYQEASRTQIFAASHSAAVDNFWEMSGLQCMSERSWAPEIHSLEARKQFWCWQWWSWKFMSSLTRPLQTGNIEKGEP